MVDHILIPYSPLYVNFKNLLKLDIVSYLDKTLAMDLLNIESNGKYQSTTNAIPKLNAKFKRQSS